VDAATYQACCVRKTALRLKGDAMHTVTIRLYALQLWVTCYITGRIAIDNLHGIHRQISRSSSQFRREELNNVMGLSPNGTVGAPVHVDPPSTVPQFSTPPFRSPPSPTPPLPTPSSLTPPLPSLERLASHFGAHVSRLPVGRQCRGPDAGSSSIGPDRSAEGLRSTPFSLRFGDDPVYQRQDLQRSCH